MLLVLARKEDIKESCLRVCPVQCSHKCPGGERVCAVRQQSSQLRAINTKDGSNIAGELQRG